MRWWARRAVVGLLLIVVIFIAAGVLSMRAGDRRLYPPEPGTATIPIFLVSHGYHSGVVLPRGRMADVASERGDAALAAVAARFALFPFVEIGWGEEGFYRSVPTMASLTVTMAVQALFMPGNLSVLHVVGLSAHPAIAFPRADIVAPALSPEGFGRLLDRIDRTFAPRPRGEAVEDLGPGLYGPSLFYRAVGTFNIFHVCNHWTADLLDAAGIPTAPVLATMPQGLFLDLQWRAGLEPLPHPIEAAK